MSDFVIQIGSAVPASVLCAALRNRPGLHDRQIRVMEFPWGSIVVQLPVGAGYAPSLTESAAAAAVGRPRFVGIEHERMGTSGFCEMLVECFATEPAAQVGRALTGMFTCCICTRTTIRVVTDRMFRPAYVCRDRAGAVVGLGTHVESLALLGDRRLDFDDVSLAELIGHSHITFPFTTRRGIEELPPAAVCSLTPGSYAIDAETYWTPAEATTSTSAATLDRNLADAVRFAGEDITRGTNRAAVTLSGGRDSRVVMASLPRERLACAITYCTRENRETDVARRVAAAVGIPHLLARRAPEFYATLLDRATRLLGTELKAVAHGYVVLDAGLASEFDLLVGGQFSDTLLKDYLMPEGQRVAILGLPILERLHRVATAVVRRNGRDPRAAASLLSRDLRRQVAERRRHRLDVVTRVRPRSAQEWVGFWPTSRHPVSSHTLGNSRLYAFESLFMHSAVLDVAARMPQELRAGGALADRVFARLYGVTASIENANTGLPCGIPPADEARAMRALRRDPERWRAFTRLPQSEHPWNDVQNSWVDSKLLQRLSPVWQEYRRRLLASPALDVLAPLLSRDVRPIIGKYQDELGANVNLIVVQLAFHIDRLSCENVAA